MPARLTVLTACRPAAGSADGGCALTSLAGALLAAGSRAVVASWWDVGDEASAVFSEQLFHRLGRGHTAAEALRRAKNPLRNDPRWQDPTAGRRSCW